MADFLISHFAEHFGRSGIWLTQTVDKFAIDALVFLLIEIASTRISCSVRSVKCFIMNLVSKRAERNPEPLKEATATRN
jgi:hypothetical protein